ncbi:MAG: type I-U CRISPR-associated protein Csx17, partial [Pirellulales bacterium]
DELQAAKKALARLAIPLDVPRELAQIGAKAAEEGWTAKRTKDEIKKFLDSQLLFELDGKCVALQKADKDSFLAELRADVLSDTGLAWLDAALVLLTGRDKNRVEAPVLGSGGNVGNSDFSAMFAQTLPEILPLEACAGPSDRSLRLLESSLYASTAHDLPSKSIGQFDPGRAGGANLSQGMEALPRLNPWDYVLMIEGALLLGGSVTRRLGASRVAGSFPFSTESSPVGYGTVGRDNTRGELWLPLWGAPASVAELRQLFGEGRAEVGTRRARTGLDFARACASLGVDRGVTTFIRYEFQERLGQSYLATSLGQFNVVERAHTDLLTQADDWVDRYRRACSDNVPMRFAAAQRRIDRAMFDFCRYGGPGRFADVVCALGNAERELATGPRFREENRLSPLVGLSPEWLAAANDGSVEFELALALSSIFGSAVGSIRTNLEPVLTARRKDGALYATWEGSAGPVVWNSVHLADNMAATLTRRLQDGIRSGSKQLPLQSPRWASLAAVAAFIAAEEQKQPLDEDRLSDLLWGLVTVQRPSVQTPIQFGERQTLPLPRSFALLKVLFSPDPIQTADGQVAVTSEPGVIPLLRANRVGEACQLAMRRLRASQLRPVPHGGYGRSTRDDEWTDVDKSVDGSRIAAALLLPISSSSVAELIAQVTRPAKNRAGISVD